MPKSLSHRLEDLENEIQVLLTLQNPTERGATSTQSAGNTKQVTFETISFKEASRVTLPMKKNKQKNRPSTSPTSSSHRQTRISEIFEKTKEEMFTNHKDYSDGVLRPLNNIDVHKTFFSNDNLRNLTLCAPTALPLIGYELNSQIGKLLCAEEQKNILIHESKENVETNYASSDETQIANKNSNPELIQLIQESSDEENLSPEQENNKSANQENVSHNFKAEKVEDAQAEEHSLSNSTKCKETSSATKDEDFEFEKLIKTQNLVGKLQKELGLKIVQLSQAEREKREAINKSQELEEKVEKLSSNKARPTTPIRNHSFKKLEKSSAATVTKVAIKAKHSANTPAKTEKRPSTAILMDCLKEKESDNKKLEQKHKEVLNNLKESHKTNKHLCETNEMLVQHVKDMQTKLKGERANVQNLEKLIDEIKNYANKPSKNSNQQREAQTQTCKDNKEKEAAEVAFLEKNLSESRKREQIYLDEAAILEVKLQKLQNNQLSYANNAELEVKHLKKEHSKLQFQLQEAAEKLTLSENKYEKKLSILQEDSKKTIEKFSHHQEAVMIENEELRYHLEELSRTNDCNKDVFQSNQELERLLKLKQTQIEKLECENCIKSDENKELIDQVTHLQVQVDLLQQTFDAYEETNNEIETQMEELKFILEEKQCQILMRDQTIQNQQDAITALQDTIDINENKIHKSMHDTKMVSEEARKIAAEMRTVSMELDKEIEEKQQSLIKTDHREITNTSLHNKVTKLEATLAEVEKLCCKMPTTDDKHLQLMTLVETLEKKADLVKKETGLRMQLLAKQKDQAVYAAKFATNKLSETVCDFQNQVEVHKKVQVILTSMLRDKDNELRTVSYTVCGNNKQPIKNRKRTPVRTPTPMEQRYSESDASSKSYRRKESDSDYSCT